MKKTLAVLAAALVLGSTLAPFDAEAAKRLGGGKSSGMQRQNTTQQTAPTAPGNATPASPAQAAPAAAGATAAAAAAPKRSWMGPIAGLAAGLGIAALASHLGLGGALANIMTIALIAMVVLFAIGWFMRKRAQSQAQAQGQQPAYAGFNRVEPQQQPQADMQQPMQRSGSMIGSGLIGSAVSTQAGRIPADFDTAAFERNARDQFMALQAANDTRDLDRLRDYLTPEMFEAARADLAERGDAPQKTEVFGLQAQVLEVAEEADSYIVSVRFTGSVRDEAGAVPDDLDEVWHLTKPRSGFGGWLIAGIQQVPPKQQG